MADTKFPKLEIDLQNALNTGLNEPLKDAERYFNQLDTLQEHLNKLTKEYNEIKKHGGETAKEDLQLHKQAIKELEKAIQLKKQYNASPLKTFAKTTFGIGDKKDADETARELGNNIKGAFKSGASMLKSVFDISWNSLADILKSVISEMNTMLQSSLLTNAKTRENVFSYGMSASESYGFEKAKGLLGISSDSDLMYMNSEQSKMFRDAMTKYAQKYSELYDKGYFTEMLQFQVESDQFKQDVELALIKMFLDNKETIISGFHALLTIANKIIDIVNWIGARQTDTASDVLNNYSTKNVSIDTTFNISGEINKESAVILGTQTNDYLGSVVQNY